ncbi:MAG: DUF3857 domain-containing protein [Myxococcota bacterium]|nr:DUF3857 domain-containing protein [Myxococcota bacterium]
MQRFWLTFLLLILHACAGRTPFPVVVIPQSPNASDWPDAGAAIIDEVAVLRYEWDEDAKPFGLRAVIEHWRRLKILRESGLDESRIRLPLDEFSRIEDIQAQSVSALGDVARMSSGSIRLLGQDHPDRLARAKDTIVFDVPRASVGGIIDYRYRRVFENPLWVPVWRFGTDKPTLRSELSVITPKNVRFDYRYGQGKQVQEKSPLRQTLDDGLLKSIFVETNLAPVFAEPFMPDKTHLAPWLAFSLRRFVTPDGRKFRMNTWQDVFKILRSMFKQVGGDIGHGGVIERYRETRDGLKGSILPGIGVLQPRSAGKLLAGEPACSRDAAALLQKRLQGSGAKSYIALALSAESFPLPEDFVSLSFFDRVLLAMEPQGDGDEAICREDTDGEGLFCEANEETYVFLEPSCGLCRFAELSAGLTPGRVLIAKDEGPIWHDMELNDPNSNRLSTQYSMRLKVDGALTGRMNGQARGVWAQGVRSIFRNERERPRDQNAFVKSRVQTEESLFDFSAASLANLERIDEPLGFAADLQGKIEALGYDRFRLRPIELVGPVWPQTFRSLHVHDAYLPGPFWIESALALELPLGFVVEPRPLVKIVRTFAEYAAGYEKIDQTLNYTRRLILKKRHISPNEWPDFIDFIREIKSVESRGIEVWREDTLFEESPEP